VHSHLRTKLYQGEWIVNHTEFVWNWWYKTKRFATRKQCKV